MVAPAIKRSGMAFAIHLPNAFVSYSCIFLVILNHYRGYLLRIPYPLPIYSLSSPSNGKVGNANRSKSDSNKRSWMTRYFSNSDSANACACS